MTIPKEFQANICLKKAKCISVCVVRNPLQLKCFPRNNEILFLFILSVATLHDVFEQH